MNNRTQSSNLYGDAPKPLTLPGMQDFSNVDTHMSHRGVQHIGFKLDQDEFLLDMRKVREIIMMPKITFLPRTDDVVEGVYALRGEIMPALNLRKIMDLKRNQEQPSTRVIIIQTDRGGFGIIVDDITEFTWLEDKSIESLDQNFFGTRYHFLSGVSKIGNKMCGILDIEKLMKRFPEPTCNDEEEC